jgi:hypothetical protein
MERVPFDEKTVRKTRESRNDRKTEERKSKICWTKEMKD